MKIKNIIFYSSALALSLVGIGIIKEYKYKKMKKHTSDLVEDYLMAHGNYREEEKIEKVYIKEINR